jgi:hypothetical protein
MKYLIPLLATALTACAGEDGKVGAKGVDGKPGENYFKATNLCQQPLGQSIWVRVVLPQFPGTVMFYNDQINCEQDSATYCYTGVLNGSQESCSGWTIYDNGPVGDDGVWIKQ